MTPSPTLPLPPVLVLGHPGHELRIWHWVTVHRPVVFILTDGSGAHGEGRIGDSMELLEQAGCPTGAWMGAFPDSALYRMMLSGDVEPLVPLVRSLADEISRGPGRPVVGDLAEGYNSAHDLCRGLISTAVALAARQGGEPGPNWGFPLNGHPGRAWLGRLKPVEVLDLDEAAQEEKFRVATGYAPLKAELDAALTAETRQAFAREYFYEVPLGESGDAIPEEPPYYEVFGEKRVKEGIYQEVIRYRGHILPMLRRLREACGIGQFRDKEAG